MAASITVTGITPNGDGGLVRHGIDAPTPGWRSDGATLKCVGWVAAAENTVVAVELAHRGTVLRHEAVSIPRPDVVDARSAGEEATALGYWFLAGLLGLPLEASLDLAAVLQDGRRHHLATIRVERAPLQGERETRFAPLFVTSLGRMGTTWLLRLLSRHPGVLTFDQYPFEVRPGVYWLHALRVLAEPADTVHSSHPDDFPFDVRRIGHNPFNTGFVRELPAVDRWFSGPQLSEHVRWVQANIDGFYGALAESAGAAGAKLFVEKAPPGHVGQLASEVYPAGREIILVRDPRDVLASVLAFDRKRGYEGFGTDRHHSRREFVVHLRQQMEALLTDWQTRRGRVLLVRYEDLVTDPKGDLAVILGYLELDHDLAGVRSLLDAVDHDDDTLRDHRTSVSAADSIGRWRRDLDPELHAMAKELLDPVLEPFGYG